MWLHIVVFIATCRADLNDTLLATAFVALGISKDKLLLLWRSFLFVVFAPKLFRCLMLLLCTTTRWWNALSTVCFPFINREVHEETQDGGVGWLRTKLSSRLLPLPLLLFRPRSGNMLNVSVVLVFVVEVKIKILHDAFVFMKGFFKLVMLLSIQIIH